MASESVQYQFGSPDPVSYHYHSPSGSDTKIYFFGHADKVREAYDNNLQNDGWKSIPDLQAFTFEENLIPLDEMGGTHPPVIGSLVFILLGKKEPYLDLLDEKFSMLIRQVNEFGASWTQAILGVRLTKRIFGLTIDDTVSEVQFRFIADEYLPIKYIEPTHTTHAGPK